MAMGIGRKKASLCVGVVINGFSFEQLTLLRACFDGLSELVDVILIKHQPGFPAVFYQLIKIRLLEEQANTLAKKDLYWAASVFNYLAIRYVFNGPRVAHVLGELPEIDCLIGHGLEKQYFLRRKSSTRFVGGLRSFIEMYGRIDKNNSIAADDCSMYPSIDPAKPLFGELDSKVIMLGSACIALDRKKRLSNR